MMPSVRSFTSVRETALQDPTSGIHDQMSNVRQKPNVQSTFLSNLHNSQNGPTESTTAPYGHVSAGLIGSAHALVKLYVDNSVGYISSLYLPYGGSWKRSLYRRRVRLSGWMMDDKCGDVANQPAYRRHMTPAGCCHVCMLHPGPLGHALCTS
eukprot:1825719-Pyramimonas_sp.AAC.3